MRFEWQVQHFLGAERVLEHMRRRREGLVDVAAPQPEIERDIGALAALEMLEVGESAGWLQFIVHQRLVFGRLDLVENRRQFLVFRYDLLRGLVGDMRIAGEHHRDRFADKMHLANGQDRLVVECRPVIGISDDFPHVVAGIDGVDAGHFAGGAGVDRLDAAMRDRAAEDFCMQHAGQLHQMSVFGAAGHLVAPFKPRQRAADLSAG